VSIGMLCLACPESGYVGNSPAAVRCLSSCHRHGRGGGGGFGAGDQGTGAATLIILDRQVHSLLSWERGVTQWQPCPWPRRSTASTEGAGAGCVDILAMTPSHVPEKDSKP
jgi:hypothetical protein